MQILVLDTIHGGMEIGSAYRDAGHTVDIVDVYHGTTPDLSSAAKTRSYDLVVAPVHLDPDHPLRAHPCAPVISHHEAIRQLLADRLPHPFVEITGARGKTTAAHALAHILVGNGVLHTSTGTYSYPTKAVLWKRSITPASVLPAAAYAHQMQGWLIAEESLGVTGAGDLAIITSAEDYPFAGKKKCALKTKIDSAVHAKRVLVADGIFCDNRNVIHIGDVAHCEGKECTVEAEGMKYILKNPLFALPPYRMPLMLAAAAALLLHVDPAPLNSFTALPGRMSVSHENNVIIVDNANSGTNIGTTVCASQYARHCAGMSDLTLVIGQVVGDGAVCEGFTPDQIAHAITTIHPDHVVWVGKLPDPATAAYRAVQGRVDAVCITLEEGKKTALQKTDKGSIVLAVKTWR